MNRENELKPQRLRYWKPWRDIALDVTILSCDMHSFIRVSGKKKTISNPAVSRALEAPPDRKK